MEGIVGGAIKGLGAMFRLRGNIFSPQGIELSLPLQPVSDVTQLGRYGAAVPQGADGWILMRIDDGTTGVETSGSTLEWGAQTGMPPDDDLVGWIYDMSITADYETAVNEVGIARIALSLPASARFGPGTKSTMELWASSKDDLVDLGSTGQASMINVLRPTWPLPWFRGQSLFMTVQGLQAIKVINFEANLLMRFVPAGIPPLP